MAAMKYEGGRNRRERQVRRLTWVDMYSRAASRSLGKITFVCFQIKLHTCILTLDAY